MMTDPSIAIASKAFRIASIAAMSAAASSPRPMKRADASAAASVTRTTSMARLRSIGRPSVAQQPLEEQVPLGDEDAVLARVALAEAAARGLRLALVARDRDHERDRLRGVGARGTRRRMVRNDEHPPLVPALPQALDDRPDQVGVEALDRLHL